MRRLFASLMRDRRGAVAVTFAVLMVPITLAMGVSVDLARGYLARGALSSALDLAVLAAAATTTSDQDVIDTGKRFFAANYHPMSAEAAAVPTVTVNNSVVEMTASASLNTTFLRLAGMDRMSVGASAQAIRQTTGLEVALVLDSTGSMAYNGKIDALRTAATSLVDILFGSQDTPDFLKMSVVPYVTTVNIGPQHTDWVKSFSGSSYSPSSWKGCIEERPYPYDVSDKSAAIDGLWTVYRWPPEPRYETKTTTSSQCPNRANSKGTGWNSIDEVPSDTYGPNKSCPEPITALTNAKSTVRAAVQAVSPWNNGGTMSHVGMIWGLRTISPDGPWGTALPYNTPKWHKAIIILTDGVNWLNRQNTATCYDKSGGPYTDFTGYGYPVEDDSFKVGGTYGSDRYNRILTELDKRTLEACALAKQNGVTVYTITFQASDSRVQDVFRQCASDPSKYYDSPSNEQLQVVFRAIGTELSNLRISR